jgi:hypothetical protein
MRWPRSILGSGSLVVALLIAMPVHAGSLVIKRGEAAPADGLLLDEDAARAAADMARDGLACRMDNDTLHQLLATHQEKLDQLQKSADAYSKAVAIYEKNEAVRDRLEERLASQLARDERVMGQMERAVDTALKAADRADRALEKAEDRIQAANSRGFWATAISFVAGIFLGPIAGGLLR